MSNISMREIQSTLQTLWIDNEICEDYFHEAAADSQSDSAMKRFLSVSDRRGVELYGRLLRYGWHDVMSSIYPLCEELLGDEWQGIVDNYLKTCPPKHFNLNRLGEQFPWYLTLHEEKLLERLPFVAQLADYEWLELEVLEHPGVVARARSEALSSIEQFDTLCPIVNPTLCKRRYDYAVSNIADLIERGDCFAAAGKAKETFIIGFRPERSSSCRILEMSELATAVLEAALEQEYSYKDLAVIAIDSCEGLAPQDAALEFIGLIERLQNIDVLVGSRTACREKQVAI